VVVFNILVRIINELLGDGQYFRRKGMIAKVVDDYVTKKVQVQDDDDDPSNFNGDMLQLDQDDLETVSAKQFVWYEENIAVCMVPFLN
jgi:KN17 SH3-like C-terminal domain